MADLEKQIHEALAVIAKGNKGKVPMIAGTGSAIKKAPVGSRVRARGIRVPDATVKKAAGKGRAKPGKPRLMVIFKKASAGGGYGFFNAVTGKPVSPPRGLVWVHTINSDSGSSNMWTWIENGERAWSVAKPTRGAGKRRARPAARRVAGGKKAARTRARNAVRAKAKRSAAAKRGARTRARRKGR